MNKHKHLDYIQDVIKRMASNSFQLKGWTVTLVSALLAVSITVHHKVIIVGIAIIPLFFFWILDGYFLFQERLFRDLYNDVREKKDDSEIDFNMNSSDFKGKIFKETKKTWLGSIVSITLITFYLPLMIALFLLLNFLPLLLELSK